MAPPPNDNPPSPAPPAPRDSPTRVVELTVNVDDTTGERLGHACEALMQAGALDVWATPVTMKQGRPGVVLSTLAAEDDRERLTRLVLRETGSFGVRYRTWDRVVLQRDWVTAKTRFGDITLKVGRLDGDIMAVKPEYASVRRAAEQAGVTAAEVMLAAQAQADAWRAAQPDTTTKEAS